MLRWALAAAVLLAFTLSPTSRANGCSMPAELKARICDVPDLARLDAALAAKEKAVAAVTARPATWAARAAQFRHWLAIGKNFDDQPYTAEDLRSEIESHIEDLDTELARAASVKASGASVAQILGEKCLTTWLSPGCEASAAGILRDRDVRILWQLQSGASEKDGGGMGAMLWDASGAGAPRLIGWSFEGYWFRAPNWDPKHQLLWVPGTRGGTAEGNADLLYQRRAGKWVEIEIESWRDDLNRRLPDGLEAWHGVHFDPAALFATADLSKPEDAHCCATGGRAAIDLKIEGDRLAIDSLRAQKSGATEWHDY
jgi:hypothetical protein